MIHIAQSTVISMTGARLVISLAITATILAPAQNTRGQGSDAAGDDFDDHHMFTPLFSDKIFPDIPGFPSVKPSGGTPRNDLASGDPSDRGTVAIRSRSQQSTADQLRRQTAHQLANAEADQLLRQQINRVARWLTDYQLETHQIYPGVAQDDRMREAQARLTAIVPNNPYAWGNTAIAGGIFSSAGIPAQQNPNQSWSTGSPQYLDPQEQVLQAENLDRIRLTMDGSLTPQMVDYWTQDPPEEWQAPPGTITAIGNNQGLFIVWGAGADGKPVRNPFNGRAYIVSSQTWSTQGDQNAPNEDQ